MSDKWKRRFSFHLVQKCEISIWSWLFCWQKSIFLSICRLDIFPFSEYILEWSTYFPQPSNYRLIKHWVTTMIIIAILTLTINVVNKNSDSAELQRVNWWIYSHNDEYWMRKFHLYRQKNAENIYLSLNTNIRNFCVLLCRNISNCRWN